MFGNSSKSWKLFSLFGHEIYITPWFLLLIAFFSFSGLQAGAGVQALQKILIWAPVLFGGILFHEFGHAFAMQAYGYGGSRIELHGFGGVTINQRRQQSPPGQSIVISLAGPIASTILGVASYGALLVWGEPDGGFLTGFLSTMALVNIFWAVFNMLPINPMDGGHVVLHALRWGLKDARKAVRYSAISSLVVLALSIAAAFALGYAGTSLLWILLLGAMFGMQNWQMLQATQRR
jgi:Zn-dependent protease